MAGLAAAARDAAVRFALLAAGAAASAACTNDYDAFGGDGATATSSAEGSGGGTATTGGGAGHGGAGTGGQGGAGHGGAGGHGGGSSGGGDAGGGGAAALPGEAPCEGLALDFAFDVDAALPDPWTQSIAGQADLATANGDLLVTFVGPGRDRGSLLAPVPGFAECSVTVEVPEPPRWTGVENALAAAFLAASVDGEDAPALALLFGVDATGTATSTYAGAVDLPVTGAPLEWPSVRWRSTGFVSCACAPPAARCSTTSPPTARRGRRSATWPSLPTRCASAPGRRARSRRRKA